MRSTQSLSGSEGGTGVCTATALPAAIPVGDIDSTDTSHAGGRQQRAKQLIRQQVNHTDCH
jgi:hypothetical protein